MFCIDNAAKAKKSARSLEKFFKKSGVALAHGHALNAVATMAGFTDWNAMLESLNQANAAPAPKEPSILDIDFQKVSTIRVWGSEYNFDINSTTWDAFRNRSEAEPQVLLDEDEVILELQSLNDEVYGDEELTVSELLDFKWNSEHQCFTNSKGQDFEALILTVCDFGATGPKAAAIEPPYVREHRVVRPEVTRYKVYVYCDEQFVGMHVCVAKTKAAAEEAAMEDMWDDRVERYEARIFSEVMEDTEGGPFIIFAGGQEHAVEDSFAEAYRLAKQLASDNPSTVVEIKDEIDNLIVSSDGENVVKFDV